MTDLLQTVDSLASTRVLVVGDVMLDRYWWGAVTRISPEAPVPVVKLGETTLAAGGAANVGVNVAGLGAQVSLCGVIGTDEGADLLLTVLGSSNVASEHLFRTPEHPTIVKTRVLASGQQIARIDQESVHTLSAEAAGRLLDSLLQVVKNSDVVVVSDYAKGFLTEGVLEALIGESRRMGKPVLIDPKGRQYAKYRGASVITPNSHEAADACGLDELSDGVIDNAGRALLSGHEFDAVFITQGADGMTLFRRDKEPVHFPAAARTVYDVTGAGDTVIATLGTCIGAGASLETAARLANLAAGLVVEQAGTSAVSIEALRRAAEAAPN